MGDAFKDHLDTSLDVLLKSKVADRVDVPADRRFVGFGAFEKVLASDVNYVILATPPGFRAWHLKAAVAAGKNIFAEKPVAVDGSGIRLVLEVYKEAKEKGLAIGVGTQRRHQNGYLQNLQRVHDGGVGGIVTRRVHLKPGAIWVPPQEGGW